MQWKRLSSRFSAITKTVLPPRYSTVGWHTTIRTGLNNFKVVSSPNPQGAAKRPPKVVPPKAVPPKAVPPKTVPPKAVSPKVVSPKPVPPKVVPPKAVPPKAVPLRPTTAIHNRAKRTSSKPLEPQPKASPPTEIDRYFTDNFPEFPYDPTRPAAEQFALLRRANNFWGSDKNGPSEKDKQERCRFNEAFRKEFTAKFGYLGGDWRYLAHVLGQDPIPKTVGKFEKVWMRRGIWNG